ncbi:pyrroline-5-carboxylate reductase [Parasalinivibrio latis]|uniref:pyrroline-5-carboxylate reductase n=1 Tax=Parasalinivibrio latis TaxID=2952610 RepID=UPI0030E37D0B
MEPRQIAFVGAGNMATAIIAGLVKAGYPADNIIATDPNADSRVRLGETYGIFTSGDNTLAVDDADVVVLAVKPQLMETVMGGLKDIDWNGKLVISIAAGISVARLNQLAGTELSVVRVMPNTPALVSKGMSGLFAPASVSDADREFAGKLMQAVGEVCWVEEESGINAVIAAAGSAPAYFFRFMEAMQEEAVRQGFDTETARLLVQQSALGAAEMVVANPELPLSTLREQVTSKGGTTAEALRVFNENNLSETVSEAMKAAVARAEEMEKLF